MNCLHCGKRKVVRPRGLCIPCYYTPEIKALYPKLLKQDNEDKGSEMTEAELDALIAQQMKCLPPWWKKEVRKTKIGEPCSVRAAGTRWCLKGSRRT